MVNNNNQVGKKIQRTPTFTSLPGSKAEFTFRFETTKIYFLISNHFIDEGELDHVHRTHAWGSLKNYK